MSNRYIFRQFVLILPVHINIYVSQICTHNRHPTPGPSDYLVLSKIIHCTGSRNLIPIIHCLTPFVFPSCRNSIFLRVGQHSGAHGGMAAISLWVHKTLYLPLVSTTIWIKNLLSLARPMKPTAAEGQSPYTVSVARCMYGPD